MYDTLQKLNGRFDLAMVILVAVLSDTQCVCRHVYLSSVIFNVCARVFVFSDSMFVHVCLSSVILNLCAGLCATHAQTFQTHVHKH